MDESEIRRTVTLLEDNVLQYREQYYGMTSDYTYNGIYMREGSKELEQRSEYQYLDVVTVSTVEELVEAIQDRTKVILKGENIIFPVLMIQKSRILNWMRFRIMMNRRNIRSKIFITSAWKQQMVKRSWSARHHPMEKYWLLKAATILRSVD